MWTILCARGRRTAQALCLALGGGKDASCTQVVAQPAPGTRLCNCRVETPDDLSQGPLFCSVSGPANSVASPSRRFHSSVCGHPDPDRGCSQQLCFCKKPEPPPPAPNTDESQDTMNNKDREQSAASRGPVRVASSMDRQCQETHRRASPHRNPAARGRGWARLLPGWLMRP